MNTLTITEKLRQLSTAKEDFVRKSQGRLFKNLGLSTKWSLKSLLSKARKWWKTPAYITLCPFYDEGGIKGDYDRFEDIKPRYREKFAASMEVLSFLAENIWELDIRFMLADQGVLVRWSYDTTRFWSDIQWIKDLYTQEIAKTFSEFSLQTFSQTWLTLETFAELERQYTIQDINSLLEEYWVSPWSFSASLSIIIRAFWISWAYYLVRNYLSENEQLIQMLNGAIFINTEAVSPLNSLYYAGKYKLDQTNVFARVDI